MSQRVAIAEAILAAGRARDLRGYDEIPAKRSYPYFAIGPIQIIPPADEDECGEGDEIFVQVDVWSFLLNEAETGLYVDTLREAFRTPLAIAGYRNEDQVLEDVLLTKDPAGQLAHAVLRLRLELKPN